MNPPWRAGLDHVRQAGFPWRSPTRPGSVDPAPDEANLGIDYDTAWARRYPVRMVRALVTDGVTRPIVAALAAPEILGRDRLSNLDGPVIFAANHASHIDTPILLTSLPERFRHRCVVAAGADYFFDKEWKAALWSFAINAVPIERTKVSRRSAELPAELIRQGWSLVIYPEGGRSPDGWMQTFRGGAAYLAHKTGTPLVPIYLEGTRRVLGKGATALRPARTKVCFGSPMRAAGDEDARRFSVRIEAAVAALADEAATDWWSARRRAAAGTTPSLSGPSAPDWRRAWAQGNQDGRAGRDRAAPWPPL
ncbi:MAG: lysophospholipid acyltransferase family protein [Acidimicrobiales bacterium]